MLIFGWSTIVEIKTNTYWWSSSDFMLRNKSFLSLTQHCSDLLLWCLLHKEHSLEFLRCQIRKTCNAQIVPFCYGILQSSSFNIGLENLVSSFVLVGNAIHFGITSAELNKELFHILFWQWLIGILLSHDECCCETDNCNKCCKEKSGGHVLFFWWFFCGVGIGLYTFALCSVSAAG